MYDCLTMLCLVQVPLQAVDLSHVSILYTQGDMAAITPIYDYNFQASHCKLLRSCTGFCCCKRW